MIVLLDLEETLIEEWGPHPRLLLDRISCIPPTPLSMRRAGMPIGIGGPGSPGATTGADTP